METYEKEFRSKFIYPYTKNIISTEKIFSKYQRAQEVYATWGGDAGALHTLLTELCASIIHANREVFNIVEVEIPEDVGEPKYKLISPVIDFSLPPDELKQGDRMKYTLTLETIMWDNLPGVGGADHQDVDEIIFFPSVYDLWLQIILMHEDEQAAYTIFGL